MKTNRQSNPKRIPLLYDVRRELATGGPEIPTAQLPGLRLCYNQLHSWLRLPHSSRAESERGNPNLSNNILFKKIPIKHRTSFIFVSVRTAYYDAQRKPNLKQVAKQTQMFTFSGVKIVKFECSRLSNIHPTVTTLHY